jgi:hypothetical protein
MQIYFLKSGFEGARELTAAAIREWKGRENLVTQGAILPGEHQCWMLVQIASAVFRPFDDSVD